MLPFTTKETDMRTEAEMMKGNKMQRAVVANLPIFDFIRIITSFDASLRENDLL